MDTILEKLETLIDDIERDHEVTKDDIHKMLVEIKEEIQEYQLRKDEDTLNWEDLD